MKKTTTFAALSLAAVLGIAPFLVSADDDRWEDEDYEHRRKGPPMAAEMKQYSAEEIRTMAQARVLRRFGPGVQTTVEETEDGTYLMQIRDKGDKLLREHEFNLYGMPVRGKSRH